MNVGAAVLTFREGLEAALIVAILLGYLRSIGRNDVRHYIWAGVGSAVVLTVGFVLLLQFIGAEFNYPAKGVYEGVTSLLAVGMVTYMSFWMARQGREIKGRLESGVQASLGDGRAWGLLALAFLAVLREGVETALFLSAAAFSTSGMATLTGGVAGLLVSIAIGVAVYYFGIRVNLGLFFRVAAVALVVFGAAILRYGIQEFEEVGLLPPIIERIWNTGSILPEGVGLGAVLQALVGYTSKPSLMQLVFFGGYYLIVGLALWRPWRQVGSSQTNRPAGTVA